MLKLLSLLFSVRNWFGVVKSLSPVNLWVGGAALFLLVSSAGLGFSTYKLYVRAVKAEAQVATLTTQLKESQDSLVEAKATISTVTQLAVERAKDASASAQVAADSKKALAKARAQRTQTVVDTVPDTPIINACHDGVLDNPTFKAINDLIDAAYFDTSLNLGDSHVPQQ